MYGREVRPATCRRGGCSLTVDAASPGGEWCSAHGVGVDQRRAVAAAGQPTRPFRGANR